MFKTAFSFSVIHKALYLQIHAHVRWLFLSLQLVSPWNLLTCCWLFSSFTWKWIYWVSQSSVITRLF